MRPTALIAVLILTISVAAGCGCGEGKKTQKPSPPQGTLRLLPASNELEGWVLTSQAKRYAGHDLYEPINGAADTPMERRVRARVGRRPRLGLVGC